MQLSIEESVLEKYPEVEIGYLVAQVSVKKSDVYVESIKQKLATFLQEKGINATNFVTHPNISIWRKIYEQDFQVNPKTYRSSIESLLRRIVTGKNIWNISNIVDLYNCCSILSLLPIGGYDLQKVEGDIQIRYAHEGETFLPLGAKRVVATQSNHIVYADNKRVLCWLWNHKDAAETCIDETTKHVIFFVDSFQHSDVQTALQMLKKELTNIRCIPKELGILNKNVARASLHNNF